jgi:uncharacterized protein with FMN-binding domain
MKTAKQNTKHKTANMANTYEILDGVVVTSADGDIEDVPPKKKAKSAKFGSKNKSINKSTANKAKTSEILDGIAVASADGDIEGVEMILEVQKNPEVWFMDVTGRSNVQKHRDGISMFSCVSIVD